MKPFVTMLALMLICSVQGFAQDFDITTKPGYVNLDMIEVPENAGEVTEIDIGPGLINMIRQFSDDPDVKKKMDGFFSIRVKSFEIADDETEKLRSAIDKIETKLKKEKWEKLVRVKEGEEVTNVSIKYDDKGKMQGVVVMTLKPGEEVSFINIVGSIDFSVLGDMGVDLNSSAMDSLKQAVEHKDGK